MKTTLQIILFLSIASISFAQGPLITEFHYDDSSPQDSFEFVEVYLPDPQPANLSHYKITLYQGSSVPPIAEIGDIHRFRTLADNCMTGDTPNGMYYVVEFPDTMYLGFVFGGIENGPDAIAFSGPGDVVYKFLSYSAPSGITATEGPAMGMTSTPITNGNGSSGSPVQENNSTSTTRSLQQNGFDAWTYNVPFSLAAENVSNSETGFSGNVPVELMYYNARAKQNSAKLDWATASEVNNSRFEIFHSRDGKNFTMKKLIPGAGNSAYQVTYQHEDKNLASGVHYYELRQIDLDGTIENLGIRAVTISGGSHGSLYPSNVKTIVTMKNVELDQFYGIYTSNGQLISEGKLTTDQIDVSNLNTGLYFVRINSEVLRFNKI